MFAGSWEQPRRCGLCHGASGNDDLHCVNHLGQRMEQLCMRFALVDKILMTGPDAHERNIIKLGLDFILAACGIVVPPGVLAEDMPDLSVDPDRLRLYSMTQLNPTLDGTHASPPQQSDVGLFRRQPARLSLMS